MDTYYGFTTNLTNFVNFSRRKEIVGISLFRIIRACGRNKHKPFRGKFRSETSGIPRNLCEIVRKRENNTNLKKIRRKLEKNKPFNSMTKFKVVSSKIKFYSPTSKQNFFHKFDKIQISHK